ncbi:MAG TPA: MinD/ParA family protein [Gammaproteobacteria bacterium]|nr:MinD/ParA family protein [Gammaproteobacteria bacterium]
MKSIAITSGKGGVGKSNVAVNLGLKLAQQGKRVLLFDADLGLANIDILFGFVAKHNVADVLNGKFHLRDIMVEAADGMKVLPSTSGLLQLENPSQSELAKLAEQMDEVSEDFDVLLLDTGAGLRSTALFFCSAAEEVLVVTTPEPTAITDAYAMIKVLNTDYDVHEIKLLINEAIDDREARQVFDKLAKVSKKHIDFDLDYAGMVVKDIQLEKAVRKRKPVVQSYPSAPSSQSFQRLAEKFDSIYTNKSQPLINGFWKEVLQGRKDDVEEAKVIDKAS